MKRPAGNAVIAAWLAEAADLLAAQHANPWRVAAYRRAAETVGRLSEPVHALARRGGTPALEALPHIGAGLAAAISEMVRTGRWTLLDRLRGSHAPEAVLRAVPGIGAVRARMLHEHLHVDTLDDLAMAALAGRLSAVPGIGPRRAAAIEAAVLRLVEARGAGTSWEPARVPPVALLLDVDREYRARAAAGTLPLIAPKRFNPEAKAWLPVLHTARGEWHFTALFSNTARAHQLGRTHDWVVVYAYDRSHREVQHTVVTETHGPFAGQRVVRGREPDGPDQADLFEAQPAIAEMTAK